MTEQRTMLIALVSEAVDNGSRQAAACNTLGLSERTLQRWMRAGNLGDRRQQPIHIPHNKLSELERQRILKISNNKEYAHLPPGKIVPALADTGLYLAPESTIYRILKSEQQLTHRERAKPIRTEQKPKALTATGPNEIYSWDITYLPSHIKGLFFYLYLVMDIYSRKIVGWQVYEAESSALAADLMTDICHREGIKRNQVTLHSDNGSPMKGATMLATLQELGVIPSFSRPSVSNDNPYSESLFRTLKYRPEYPEKPFKDVTGARHWVNSFVEWYNQDHLHSAIKYVTPEQRHQGKDRAILAKRDTVYKVAKEKNPKRWSRNTRNWAPIEIVKLNPDKEKTKAA